MPFLIPLSVNSTSISGDENYFDNIYNLKIEKV